MVHSPRVRTEFLLGGAEWMSSFDQLTADGTPERLLGGTPRVLDAGSRHTERWNLPVHGPGAPSSGLWLGRFGDQLFIDPPTLSDRERHYGFQLSGTRRTTVTRDGETLLDTDSFGPTLLEVPPGPAGYRVAMDSAPGSELSSRVSVAWTFRSDTTTGTGDELLPLTAVAFSPPVDDAGTARGGRLAVVPVRVERQAGWSTDLRRLAVEVSYDDGVTWHRAPLAGRDALVWHPRSGYVSLRATGADRDGNTVEQTILRAYRLR
ncbi:MAG TPA: hypothetical protein VGD43_18690 [Micromonospora sp.]